MWNLSLTLSFSLFDLDFFMSTCFRLWTPSSPRMHSTSPHRIAFCIFCIYTKPRTSLSCFRLFARLPKLKTMYFSCIHHPASPVFISAEAPSSLPPLPSTITITITNYERASSYLPTFPTLLTVSNTHSHLIRTETKLEASFLNTRCIQHTHTPL